MPLPETGEERERRMTTGELQSPRSKWVAGLLQLGRGLSAWRIGVVAATLLLALVVALTPAPDGLPQQSMVALGLILMTVVLWATMAIPQPAAAILFLALVTISGTVQPQATFSGFLSSSLWLVFGGLLIGTAAERTGFGRYVARRFLGRFRGSYGALVLGVIIGSSVLSFLVPSNMGRLAITVPVVMALAKDAGYPIGSNGHIGLVLTATVGNFAVAQGVLPGNLLNIMIVGAGETLYGINISYMRYMLLYAPVLGLAKGLLVWSLVVRFHPAPVPRSDESVEEIEKLSPEAVRVGIFLSIAILLWATDFWHGIRPGWVALVAGILCLTPGIGVLHPREAFNPRRLLIITWVGTVLSLAAVMMESGASTLVSGILARLAGTDGQSPLYGYFSMAYLSSLLATLSTFGGAIPTMAAVAAEISTATNLPLDTAVLAIAPGMSALFFPYIAAPIVVGLAMGQVSQRAALPFMVTTALLTCVLIIPLNAVWWWVMGVLP